LKKLKSIFFKVALIIIVSEAVVLFFVATMIQNYQKNLIDRLSFQQYHFIKNFIENEKKNQVKDYIDSLRDLLNILDGTIAYALYNLDDENLKKIIKSLLKKKVIKAVYIYDSIAEKVYLAGYKEGNETVISRFVPVKFTSYKFIKSDIYFDDEYLGYIKVYYDIKEIVKRLNEEEIKAFKLINQNFSSITSNLLQNKRNLYIYFAIATLLITVIVVFVLFKLIDEPLKELQIGLKSFFEFLSNPKNSVQPININTHDEFGDIARFANNGIVVTSKLHSELAELMEIVNKNVAILEFDSKGSIKNITDAFCDLLGVSKSEIIGKNVSMFGINFKEIIDNVNKKGKYKKEVKIKDRWLESTFTKKHYYVDTDEYIWIAFDVTSKKEVEFMKNNLEVLVDEKSKEIKKLHQFTMDSIKYASLIQYAVLPPKEMFDRVFKDYFIIWEPKDIVGGDIYFFEQISENEYILMVIDATGHGVAGAFMTMLTRAIERQIIYNLDKNNISPADMLREFNIQIKTLLHQYDKHSKSNAGFDGGIIYFNFEKEIMKFAGANVSMFYVDEGSVVEVCGDKYSVGYKRSSFDYRFKEHEISLKKDAFYISTDGFIDQNGGSKGFPFGKKRFINLIREFYKYPFNVQKEIFLEELRKYQQDSDRNDDITVIGFRGRK